MSATNLGSDEGRPTVPRCHAGRDGDCNWSQCPQLITPLSYCRYAKEWEAYDDAVDEGLVCEHEWDAEVGCCRWCAAPFAIAIAATEQRKGSE